VLLGGRHTVTRGFVSVFVRFPMRRFMGLVTDHASGRRRVRCRKSVVLRHCRILQATELRRASNQFKRVLRSHQLAP
jgi:hypothetical protein